MRSRKPIAFDFGDTITSDPALFLATIDTAQSAGRSIYIAVARRQTTENETDISGFLVEHGFSRLPAISSAPGSKTEHTAQTKAWVDIWIDDDPRSAVHGR